jgi:hypothetical protein
MRSARADSVKVRAPSGISILPAVSAASAVILRRRSASQPANQRAMRWKRGHQKARASG